MCSIQSSNDIINVIITDNLPLETCKINEFHSDKGDRKLAGICRNETYHR